MILKLKTRKSIYTSKQLVAYILTDKNRIEHPFDELTVLRNINRLEVANLHKDFLDNYKYQKKRKGSTALYHEILSIHPDDQEKVTTEMLQDLIQTYIKMRGIEQALVLAKAHIHEDHKHIHFMISSNEYQSSKTS